VEQQDDGAVLEAAVKAIHADMDGLNVPPGPLKARWAATEKLWMNIAEKAHQREVAALNRVTNLEARADKNAAVAQELARWQTTVASLLDLYKKGEVPSLDSVCEAFTRLKLEASNGRLAKLAHDQDIRRRESQLSITQELTYGRFNTVKGWYVLEVAEEHRPSRGRWYRPNFSDYTSRLDWVGVYTEDEVASYRADGGHTTPVPVEQVLMEFEGRAAALRARILERQREGLDAPKYRGEAPMTTPSGHPPAAPTGLPEVAVNLVRWFGDAASMARHQAETTTRPVVRELALTESVTLAGWGQSLTDALRAGTYTTTSTPDRP